MWYRQRKIIWILCIACITGLRLFSQEKQDSTDKDTAEINIPLPPPVNVFKPIIGLGTGMFTFYGDYSKPYKTNQPVISRVGFDLRVTQPLTEFLDLSFYVLFGKVGANERSDNRNLNFESKITTGGAELAYNFSHFLKQDRIIEPYLFVGGESFEFLSKTDLVDAYGNTYYYWSDGSIRNLPQGDPNSENAIRIERDYTYESDIRELNLDGFGKYAERSWAIPVGAGALLHVTDKWSFRIGTSFHFAFTDLVDGVTEESIGDRQGDKANDRFLFTSFNLNYNLVGNNREVDSLINIFNDVDFLAIDMADQDLDGIIDFEDKCPNTPENVEVDNKGCPLDSDKDGVPDFKDLEPNSVDTAIVDKDGVAISDSLLELAYLMYMDSTGMFGKTTRTVDNSEEALTKKHKTKYKVQIGKYSESISNDLADLYLSIPGVKTIQDGDITIFVVGDYNTKSQAIWKQHELADKGIAPTNIVTKNEDGKLKTVDVTNIQPDNNSSATSPSVIYRIQIGAFSKKLPASIFPDIKDLIITTSDDGLSRYYTRSYNTIEDASSRKLDLILKGYEGSFIVPFKDGKRISLVEAGAKITSSAKDADMNKVKYNNSSPTLDAELIKFRVQVGLYDKGVPMDILDKFIKLGNVSQERTEEKATRYMAGTFDDYKSAQAFREEVLKLGIADAFVIGRFKGNTISAKEALELLK